MTGHVSLDAALGDAQIGALPVDLIRQLHGRPA